MRTQVNGLGPSLILTNKLHAFNFKCDPRRNEKELLDFQVDSVIKQPREASRKLPELMTQPPKVVQYNVTAALSRFVFLSYTKAFIISNEHWIWVGRQLF